MKRKRYSRQFQRMAVKRMRSSDNIGDPAKELGVSRRFLYKWQANFDHLEPGEEAQRTSSHESSYRQQVHRLKRLLAEKTLEVDFFKSALQKVKARRQKSGDAGEMADLGRPGLRRHQSSWINSYSSFRLAPTASSARHWYQKLVRTDLLI